MSYRSLLESLVLLVLMQLTCSCGGPSEYFLIGSAHAPGADGIIEIDEIDKSNRLVTIHMERLPPPRYLGEDYDTYMVWFEGKNKNPLKAGKLAYNSETRTGDLMRTCPLNEFTVRITAERNQHAKTPGELTIAERSFKQD